MLFADPPVTWPDAPPLSPLHVVLLFAGVPLLLTAVIVLLVYAPSMARGPRYRPGLAWRAPPEWFAGPEQGLAALDTAPPPAIEVAAGQPVGATAHSALERREPESLAAGGASASW